MMRHAEYWEGMDWDAIPTPCTILNLGILRDNARTLDRLRSRCGVRVLAALKAFAAFRAFPHIRPYLDGVCASSPHEARLGAEEFGGEVHAFAPAYSDGDVGELLRWSDHLVFNSFAQLERFLPAVQAAPRRIEAGLRINPGYSEVATPLYDPCAPGSRLGIPRAAFGGRDLAGVSGLHFHAMCEQDSDTLERIVDVVLERFGEFLPAMRWLNLGGGHHITRPGYDFERLCRVLDRVQARHPQLQLYLEPGEAVALHAGVLVASVLDVVHNDLDIAILDTSASAHMPDVIEMPYRPGVEGAGAPGEQAHTYRLGGLTCLAGDVVGDYSFARPLARGSRLVFHDMAHYSMVKSNTFNGVKLPAIALYEPDTRRCEVVREFGYEDYKSRLS